MVGELCIAPRRTAADVHAACSLNKHTLALGDLLATQLLLPSTSSMPPCGAMVNATALRGAPEADAGEIAHFCRYKALFDAIGTAAGCIKVANLLTCPAEHCTLVLLLVHLMQAPQCCMFQPFTCQTHRVWASEADSPS